MIVNDIIGNAVRKIKNMATGDKLYVPMLLVVIEDSVNLIQRPLRMSFKRATQAKEYAALVAARYKSIFGESTK